MTCSDESQFIQMNDQMVEQWGLFEAAFIGPRDGNPYVDVSLSAWLMCGDTIINTAGFFDGDGTYRIRCMPNRVGRWEYVTHSSHPELDGKQGTFECVVPSEDNHGPVGVRNQYHFAYADGTPYYPFGTTCYAWTHQGESLEVQTLQTLAEKPFNKLRMCVFPKHYPYNRNEPPLHPFERDAQGNPDFKRFNPAFFQHIEQCIGQLGALGIEADVILWHPYDRWGYANMDEDADLRYLRYLIARLAAFRNVWWSLANEYDFLLRVKPMERWHRFFAVLAAEDPYQHLRSIHNGDPDMNYDHTRPEVTHVCIQNWDVKRIHAWRASYGKPVINDELEYEGNIPMPWGNIHADELVHRCWIMAVNGGYAGHGETYVHSDDVLWWSKGGKLYGESWRGFAFLRRIIEESAGHGLTPIADVPENRIFPRVLTQWYWTRIAGGMAEDCYLIYLGEHQMAALPVWLEDDAYEIDIIDTREMTIQPGDLQPFNDDVMGHNPHIEQHKPNYYVTLPTRPYQAVRFRRL